MYLKQNTTKNIQGWRRLWLINFPREQISTSTLSLGDPLFYPSRQVRTYTAIYRSPSLTFSAAIQLTMKRSALCSSALRHYPSSWATGVLWSALIPKALRSFRRHPVHSFPCPPTQPAPPSPFRSSRNSAVSCPACVPQIPQTVSASCASSRRRSHFSSS